MRSYLVGLMFEGGGSVAACSFYTFSLWDFVLALGYVIPSSLAKCSQREREFVLVFLSLGARVGCDPNIFVHMIMYSFRFKNEKKKKKKKKQQQQQQL